MIDEVVLQPENRSPNADVTGVLPRAGVSRGGEFDDRNLRSSESARAELQARAGTLVVPQVIYGERVVVGSTRRGSKR